jgi:hypothetical protein
MIMTVLHQVTVLDLSQGLVGRAIIAGGLTIRQLPAGKRRTDLSSFLLANVPAAVWIKQAGGPIFAVLSVSPTSSRINALTLTAKIQPASARGRSVALGV